MNDEMKNTTPNGIEKKLLDVANRTNADPHFVSELESKLKDIHKPKTSWSMPLFKQTSSALGWIALAVVVGYFLNWSFATLIPIQQSGANTTPNQFVCPITEPNGSTPPLEEPSTYHHGNGEIWTDLWPAGKIFMQPDNREADGSYSMKWVWWRNATGALEIEGRRLDANAEPLRVFYTGGYDDTGVYVVALIFPTTGCWEVTAKTGEASLTFVTEVVFGDAISTPDTSTQEISTPDANRPGFDFRGAKLVMKVALPDSPTQANIYRLIDATPATVEYTQTLANQFGIDGDIYNTTNGQIPDSPAFMVTDGKQQLVVYAENYYTYTSNMVESSRNYIGYQNENAETLIQVYLAAHGLEFSYRIRTNSNFDGYVLQQLSPDGLVMGHENYSPSMRITFDKDGNVLNVNATMMNFDPAPQGTYGIISAEQALQNLLDDSLPAGKIESSYGGPNAGFVPPQTWYKEYPDGQNVTIYGNVSSDQAVDATKPAIVFINAVQAIGNIAGMDELEYYTFVEATGQFVVENGIRKFNVDSWNQNVQAAYASGTARREGDQIIITNEDGNGTEYTLVNPPADLPLDIKFPESMLINNGAVIDSSFHWISIQFYADSSQMGGGGGGGGMGFYSLNLSGNPIPFPTATPAQTGYTSAELASFLRYTVKEGDTLGKIAEAYNVSVAELGQVNNLSEDNLIFVGQQIVIPGVPAPTHADGEHGTVVVTIYEKPDGRQRTQYMFLSEKDQSYFELTGDNLELLQEVDNRPIALWGSMNVDKNGLASINVEKFENLYPDLQFQVLEGTQEITEIDGMPVVLFITAGTTYIQLVSSGGYPDSNYYTDTKDVLVEVLQVPNETYAGYPAIRMFSVAPAINPITGEKMELSRTTDKIEPIPDPYGNADQYVPPDITIDTVELVYYVSTPYYQDDASNSSQAETYVQPAWHFLGHDTNGGIVDILIQALKQEYLSPIPQ